MELITKHKKLKELLEMIGYEFKNHSDVHKKTTIEKKAFIFDATTGPLRDFNFIVDFCNENKLTILKEFVKQLETLIIKEEEKDEH